MSPTRAVLKFLKESAKNLKGHAKRIFQGRTVAELFGGNASEAETKLGWNRKTIRLGLHEFCSGVECIDGRHGNAGRPLAEARLPSLLVDIRSIVDAQSQTDPSFRTQRLYTRLSVAEVRRQLIAQKGYSDDCLPSEETIRRKLNQLGYHPVRVAKSKPKKKSPKPMRSSNR